MIFKCVFYGVNAFGAFYFINTAYFCARFILCSQRTRYVLEL